MTDLALCILATSAFLIAFKYFETLGIYSFGAAVVNYLAGAALALSLAGPLPGLRGLAGEAWLWSAMLTGLLFILLINVIIRVTRTQGLSVVAVAGKLSFFIPVAFTLLLTGERITSLSLAGMALAVPAIVLTARKSGRVGNSAGGIAWALLLAVGAGTIDLLFKNAQVRYLDEANLGLYTAVLFLTAFAAGLPVAVYRVASGRAAFGMKEVTGGLALGVINFGTIWFFVRALEILPKSVVFPINNIAILALSALAGAFWFGERFSRANVAGLLLALLAIVVSAVALYH